MDGDIGVLELTDLRLRYGEVKALNGLTFSVPPGEAFAAAGSLRTGPRIKVRQVLRSTA